MKKISLATQIKKVIGNRILFCSMIFIVMIFFITVYDIISNVNQLHSRIEEKIKPIENFTIDQVIINNLDTVDLKVSNFNEFNKSFNVVWIRNGNPIYKSISWLWPFSWVYDYKINEVAGYQFGFFRISGSFLSDKTLIFDLAFRLSLLIIFILSVLSILFPLAKKIPEKLFLTPINRFIDLISNRPLQEIKLVNDLPFELEILEKKIIALLQTATEHERNKVVVELGHLLANLAHDIRSPLAAMEMSLKLLSKNISHDDLFILNSGIQSLQDIATNVLERYRDSRILTYPQRTQVNEPDLPNVVLLFSLVEILISQKQIEWHADPCRIMTSFAFNAKKTWIMAPLNEVKITLSNLLNNAYDALKVSKNKIIYLILEIIDEDLVLHIQDNGVGIPFEKIEGVLNGLSLKHPGKGLGLSKAKQLIERFGGKLTINSIYGEGTKVSLYFPFVSYKV